MNNSQITVGKAKRKNLILAIGALTFFVSSAQAGIVTYEFSFTAADMMGYDVADGASGSTAVDNSLFDGARLVRQDLGVITDGDGKTRSYVTGEKDDFVNWADNTDDKFLGFNMWGLDGNGANWGDDFKPTDWVSQGDPTGWDSWQYNWPASCGSPPAGYITDEFVGWDSATYGDALSFGDASNSSVEFSFIVDLDTDDMFWGGATNGAPNTLPELTFWFGGWMGSQGVYADGDAINWNNPSYMYEGNMVLTGTQVPEPSILALFGLGLAGLGFTRRRRTRQS